MKAAASLKEAESYLAKVKWYRSYEKEISGAARQAVQEAEDSRLITLKRQEEERGQISRINMNEAIVEVQRLVEFLAV